MSNLVLSLDQLVQVAILILAFAGFLIPFHRENKKAATALRLVVDKLARRQRKFRRRFKHHAVILRELEEALVVKSPAQPRDGANGNGTNPGTQQSETAQGKKS